MTNPDKTAIALVLDRSGSIHRIRDDLQGAVNAFIEEQKRVPGEATLTLTQFDTRYEVVHLDVPLAEVGPVTIEPRGATALQDAVARTITELGSRLASLDEGERPGKVLFVIATDGQENSSVEFPREEGLREVRAMIDRQRSEWNWEFIFLGVGIDGFTAAGSFGIGRGQTISVDRSAAGVGAAGQAVSSYAMTYRTRGEGDFGVADHDLRTDDHAS